MYYRLQRKAIPLIVKPEADIKEPREINKFMRSSLDFDKDILPKIE